MAATTVDISTYVKTVQVFGAMTQVHAMDASIPISVFLTFPTLLILRNSIPLLLRLPAPNLNLSLKWIYKQEIFGKAITAKNQIHQ
jgi:hypothetical protein